MPLTTYSSWLESKAVLPFLLVFPVPFLFPPCVYISISLQLLLLLLCILSFAFFNTSSCPTSSSAPPTFTAISNAHDSRYSLKRNIFFTEQNRYIKCFIVTKLSTASNPQSPILNVIIYCANCSSIQPQLCYKYIFLFVLFYTYQVFSYLI